MPLRVLLLASALLLAGCSLFIRSATVTSRSGEVLCRLHRTPIITVPAYEFDYRNLLHTGAERLAFDRKYPNAIGIQYQLRRSEEYPTPARARYCVECQDELLKRFPDALGGLQ